MFKSWSYRLFTAKFTRSGASGYARPRSGKTSALNENDLSGFVELYAAIALAFKGH